MVAEKLGTMGLRARRFQVEELVAALLPDSTQFELGSHRGSNKIRPESTGSEAHRTTGLCNVGVNYADSTWNAAVD